MRTMIAAGAFALIAGAAFADDGSLRAWNQYYVKGMNMGPNAPYAQDYRGPSRDPAYTAIQQPGRASPPSGDAGRPARRAKAVKPVQLKKPRQAR